MLLTLFSACWFLILAIYCLEVSFFPARIPPVLPNLSYCLLWQNITGVAMWSSSIVVESPAGVIFVAALVFVFELALLHVLTSSFPLKVRHALLLSTAAEVLGFVLGDSPKNCN